MLHRFVFTTIALTLVTVLLAAQTPEVTFKAEVTYVEEDVRVIDKQGRFVRGLARGDFQLSEDGREQEIGAFGLVDIPVVPVEKPLYAGASALPIEPDIASNVQGLEGRFYLILLDDYHVSARRSPMVRQIVRWFILEKLGANDQAAVLVTSGDSKGTQPVTQNRHLLLAAVDRFVGQKLRSATLALLDPRARELRNPDDPQSVDPNDIQDLDAAERMHKARAALSSLRNVVEWLSAVRGRRKAVVYVSEGIDYNSADLFTGKQASNFSRDEADIIQRGLSDAISTASRGNVQIYPVDPRGLSGISQDEIEVDSRMRLPELRLAGYSLEQELQMSQSRLRMLADETGGLATVGTNDFSQGFERIVQESSSYYVLGYRPTNEKYDGKLRSISVKVKGRPDVQVTYRKGYVAPSRSREPQARATPDSAGGVDEQLMKAMVSPLPLTGLGMRMTAVPRKGAGTNASVELLVETSGKDLRFRESGGAFNSTLSLSIGVFDKSGTWVTGERPVIRLPLKPDTHTLVVQSGLRMLSHLEVPPGLYQIRVAAQDSVGLKQGSVYLDIEVPDFLRDPLAMSGVAIASTADISVATGKDQFSGGLPGPMTAVREFPPGEELSAFVEVYDNRPVPAGGLDVSTTIRASDGRVRFTNTAQQSSDGLNGPARTFRYGVRIPTIGWGSGLYVMTIEARSRTGNLAPVSRTIQFKVR